MQLIKKGKTKDVYLQDDGNYLLYFKDTVTGHPDGSKDPGGNSVVGEVEGVAYNALKVTKYYFELLKSRGIGSHYISAAPEKRELIVKPAVMFGKGLEFICRFVACGSFIRRFGDYIAEGTPLDGVFEITLKDDDRNDPPATKEILAALNLITPGQYEDLKKMTLDICTLIKKDLAEKGLSLYDIKLEFGLVDGKVTLIDEISAGNMRVYKNGKKLSYEEASSLIVP